VNAIEAVPASTTPLDAVAAALEAVVPVFQERHKLVRQRQAVIAATPGLSEPNTQDLSQLIRASLDQLKGIVAGT
jgi:hypothetical protein